MKIIALHAQAGAGKDTFADVLVDRFHFVKRGFADPLYEEVAHAFRVSVPWLRDRSRKEAPQDLLRLLRCYDGDFIEFMRNRAYSVTMPLSPRVVLQQWGTEYRRTQTDRYWIDQMAAFHQRAIDQFGLVGDPMGIVVPDMRFENEAQWVLDEGGHTIEIVRPGLAAVEGEHASAKRLPDRFIREVVSNDGTLHDLRSVAIITMRWQMERDRTVADAAAL